jgi:hypothetical protein
MKTRGDKRTTVSLAGVVWKWAEEMMVAKGFNDNFSAYVADLIRRDKERVEGKPGSNADPHPPRIVAAAEDRPLKKKTGT